MKTKNKNKTWGLDQKNLREILIVKYLIRKIE
jgi:hypothetical protein